MAPPHGIGFRTKPELPAARGRQSPQRPAIPLIKAKLTPHPRFPVGACESCDGGSRKAALFNMARQRVRFVKWWGLAWGVPSGLPKRHLKLDRS